MWIWNRTFAWQVDAAKLGASADIFFNVALEAPIII